MRKSYHLFNKKEVILVTGASGFIGANLSCKLLAEGAIVIGIDNMNSYYDTRLKEVRLKELQKYNQFIFCKGNIADKYFIDTIFENYCPDIVVNLAAQAGVRYSIENPQSYVESNLVGFFNILEACRHSFAQGNHPVKHLVFASSSSVYGNQKKIPFSVGDNVDRPVSLYAATKKSNELMAYSYASLYGIPSTGLRFFTVYGPMGRPDMAYYSFSQKILLGQPIKIFNNGDLYRDFTYVDDITEGVMRIMYNPPFPDSENVKYKIYNIGNNHPVKLMYFIELLEKMLGKQAIKEFCPMQPGDVYQTYADLSGLEEDFDFRPCITIEEGLSKFTEWFIDFSNKI